jgi:hypothetical protein
MKNFYFLLVLLVGLGLGSCKNQDDIYMEFVKKGGNVYPEKTNNLGAYVGYKRIKLVWDAPKDPSVKTAKVYWDNKTMVKDINYSAFPGDKVELIVDNLEERTYTFQLINFDTNGNQSMVSEVIAAPYAENWLVTHAERTVMAAEVKGTDAEIKMNFGTNEMIATRFRYINADGDTIELEETLDAYSSTILFPNAISGKRFEYSSSYCPAEGLDTIWNDWIKSPTPISGKLDCKSWNVTVTTGQIWDNNFLPSKAVDGVIDRNYRWCSAQGALANVFPKIMVVDNQKDSYYINKVSLYQDQATMNRRFGKSVEMYWGNEPFDPDAGTDYANSPGFADAIAKGNWLTTTFWFSTATWTKTWSQMQEFQYFAIVWKNSRSGSGWIDLWEIEFYGYDSAAD